MASKRYFLHTNTFDAGVTKLTEVYEVSDDVQVVYEGHIPTVQARVALTLVGSRQTAQDDFGQEDEITEEDARMLAPLLFVEE